ncbi:MAG: hypothetical protein ACXWC9_02075, partial [Pseudobdellovibrionaceae bacterium]
MKKMIAICCLCLSLPLVSFAVEKQKSLSPQVISQMKTLASDFYLNKTLQKTLGFDKLRHPGNPNCEPQTSVGSCVDAACKHLPTYQCDDLSEIREISTACANNYDGSCVDASCSRLPSYQCDDRSEVIEIAKSCSGSNGTCVTAACSHMPSYQCDDRSEIIALTN